MYSQRGNVLFLILLAIILFAALSYAVQNSMRGNSSNAVNESAASKAAAIEQYFGLLENTVQRMMTTGDIKDYELNFYYQSSHNSVYGANDNPNCTASRCRVFDPAGGAAPILRSTNFGKIGGSSVVMINYKQAANMGSTSSDIIMTLEGVDWNICQAINQMNDITSMPTGIAAPGSGGETGSRPYRDTFPVGAIPDTTLWAAPASITQHRTFCYCASGSLTTCQANASQPIIAHVILAR